MKEYLYTLQMIDMKGGSRTILENESSIERIRNVCFSIKKKPGRRLIILRNGKELPGGPNALDDIAYERWLINAAADDLHDATCSCSEHGPPVVK